ncbi:hypothetical protein [Spirulina major]|uniref:hypothetical protein n=1 Tax=Spirulina major TaxID=270636 RepID=UPI00093368C8|nr:hypothetical protein [Spirulina major]
MHLELMAKLLDTERKYRTKGKRIGIFDDLEKCFHTSSRTEAEAIQQAQDRYALKGAIASGDLHTVRQLTLNHAPSNNKPTTWGDAKFGKKS